jgi:probable phosphoglycerate mutase
MDELILVRHGQSEQLEQGLTGGWTNTGLTDLGKKQSEQTGYRLQSFVRGRTPVLYASDLDRAVETAQIIGKILGVRPQYDESLRELNWGIAIDMTLEEAQKIELAKTEPLIDWVPFNGAESRRMLYERLAKFLNTIDEKLEALVIIVSHGNAIRSCIYWWLEMPVMMQSQFDFDIDTCSITHLRINDWEEKTLSVLNSSDHLLPLRLDK